MREQTETKTQHAADGPLERLVRRKEIPKYVACCVDDEDVLHYGGGNTPDEAYNEFMAGEFEDYCDYYLIDKDANIEVFIYTAIRPSESEFDEDEINPDWVWLLDKKVETRIACTRTLKA